ncbi:putative major sperm protein (MSP) [Helianthus annuus]|nr:putative major sperm protein (MSP) [Helianthus annuus]
MQAQKEAPPDMQCRDKFLLQSVIAKAGATPKDITPEMFTKDSGNKVEECKLRVVYLPPIPSTSSVVQGAEEVFTPKGSAGSRMHVDSLDKSSE